MTLVPVTFLVPAALGLLGLIPVVVLIYMLRRRRPRQRVSSIMLWQQLTYEAEGRFNWHLPLRDLLLLAQILVVAALALAMTRTALLGPPSRHLILVVDASASMQSTDVWPSRLEEAKRQAGRLIDRLNPADRVTLIRAAAQPQVLVSRAERVAARGALDALVGGASRTNLRDSLSVAAAMAAQEPGAEINVLSDGEGDDLSTLPPIPAPVKLTTVGVDGNNQAITTLAVRRSLVAPFNYVAFVRVANFSPEEAEVPMVAAADSQEIDRRSLRLPGHSHSEMVISLPVGVHALQVSLLNPNGGLARTDYLPLDDHARVELPPEHPLQVQLVSADPRSLKGVLDQLPGLELTVVDPAEYDPQAAAEVTIFDGFLPSDLPSGNLLIINPQGNAQLFAVGGEIEELTISSYDLSNSLLASVDLTGLVVPKAVKTDLPTWANQVIGSDKGPLVFQGMQEGRRIVVFTFSPNSTNLPFRVSFPILMANTMSWLRPAPPASEIASEQPLLIRPLPGTSEVTVERPDGSTADLKTSGEPVAFTETRQVGSYRVTYRGPEGDLGTDEFAVNMVHEGESQVSPRASLDGLREALPAGQPTLPPGLDEIWTWLASLALLLLLIEWWLYNRQTATAVAQQASHARMRSRRL